MSKNDELLALSSVELRRRIGTKEISPVELLEACIARIEALNPAVNAICATVYDRARREAKAAEKAALRGEPLGPLHGLPTGIKDLHDTEGLLTTYGSPLYRDHRAGARLRHGGARARGRRHRRRQDQRPRVRRRRQHAQPRLGRDRQPVRPAAQRRRLVRRLGGGAGVRHAARLHRLRHRRLAAHPGRLLRRRRLAPVAGPGADGVARPLGWTPISVLGPMGRTVADTRQLFAAQIGMDDRDPLSFALAPERGRRRPARRPRRACAWPGRRTSACARCRARSARVMRERMAAMRHLFRSCDEVAFDFGEADRCFDVIRALELRRPLPRRLRQGPELARAQRARQLRDGRGHVARRRGLGARRADAHLPPLPGRRSATTTWCWRRRRRCRRSRGRELYLAEMDGKPLRNYYHWLALTYVITLVTNPAISLPCGRRPRTACRSACR